MKRIPLPHETSVQGLQFSDADTRALMELLIGVVTNQTTQADRTFANLLILRYGYFLAELEREQVVQPAQSNNSSTVRPDLRRPPVHNRRKRKGGRR